MLRIDGVSLTRDRRQILAGIDLEIREGETRFLVGASGSGKTTVLRVAAGLTLPDRGRVIIDGRKASESAKLLVPPHRRRIGMVFQDGALWDHMTVEQHLRFALGRRQGDRRARQARVDETLRLFDLLGRRDERPAHLSGGERQRVGLARAIVGRPRLLLLDEPLAHVDLPAQRELAQRVAGAAGKDGITSLWVTHRPGEVAFLGGDVSVLEQGRIVRQVGRDDVSIWLRELGP